MQWNSGTVGGGSCVDLASTRPPQPPSSARELQYTQHIQQYMYLPIHPPLHNMDAKAITPRDSPPSLASSLIGISSTSEQNEQGPRVDDAHLPRQKRKRTRSERIIEGFCRNDLLTG